MLTIFKKKNLPLSKNKHISYAGFRKGSNFDQDNG